MVPVLGVGEAALLVAGCGDDGGSDDTTDDGELTLESEDGDATSTVSIGDDDATGLYDVTVAADGTITGRSRLGGRRGTTSWTDPDPQP